MVAPPCALVVGTQGGRNILCLGIVVIEKNNTFAAVTRKLFGMNKKEKGDQPYQVVSDEELGQISGGSEALIGADPCELNSTEEHCLAESGCSWRSSDSSCHRRGLKVF